MTESQNIAKCNDAWVKNRWSFYFSTPAVGRPRPGFRRQTSDGDVERASCEIAGFVNDSVFHVMRSFTERSVDVRRRSVQRHRLINTPVPQRLKG